MKSFAISMHSQAGAWERGKKIRLKEINTNFKLNFLNILKSIKFALKHFKSKNSHV